MLTRKLLRAVAPVAILPVFSTLTPASAEDLSGASYFGQVGKYADRQEIRLGVMAYDRGLFSTDDFNGTVINGEFLFKSPEFLEGIGSPRPYIGFDAAIADDPIHFVYTGLNWDFQLTEKFYLTTSVGGAITTANDLHNPTTYKALGCRVLFHLGAGLGYDFDDHWTAQLYADHFSNANLCDENNGAEAAGVRLGYRF